MREHRREELTWTWPWLIAVVVARAILAMIIGLAVWGVAPVVIGWKPTTVSSGSMLPRLEVGDIAVSRPLGDQPPTLGTVLLFHDPDHPDRLRLHRFVAVDPDGRLVTRGDANEGNDSTPIELSAIVGVGTLRVPYLALPVVWAREGRWLPLGFTLAVLTALSAVAVHGRRFGFDPPTPSPPTGAADQPPPADLEAAPPAPAASSAPMVAVGLSVGALLFCAAVPSAAAFSDTTTSDASLGALPYFSCGSALTALTPYVWYRMDETSALDLTADDASGNGRTGVYSLRGRTVGAARSCPNSRDTGTAMTYTASQSPYLSSPLVSGAAPNVFSVAIWFKTTTTNGGKLIGYGSSQTGASGSYDRHLYLTNAGKVVFGVYPNAVKVVQSTATYNDGAWHLAVGTLSADGMRLYLDGELVGSDASTTTGQSLSNGYWRIAYDNLNSWVDVPSSFWFNGTLDDAAVFTKALSPAQVRGIWTARS